MHKDCQKTDIVTCKQMYPEARTTCGKVWFAPRPPGLGMQITGCGLTIFSRQVTFLDCTERNKGNAVRSILNWCILRA